MKMESPGAGVCMRWTRIDIMPTGPSREAPNQKGQDPAAIRLSLASLLEAAVAPSASSRLFLQLPSSLIG